MAWSSGRRTFGLVPVGNLIRLVREGRIAQCFCLMREAYSLVWSVLVLLFRSRVSLEAEILILRHQLNIHQRHVPKRVAFSAIDRLIFVGLYRLVPNTVKALTIVKPDTSSVGTVPVSAPLRPTNGAVGNSPLIREMSIANPLWGAPRIHGELLKLGIEIGQTSVAKPKGSPISSLKPVAGSRSLVT